MAEHFWFKTRDNVCRLFHAWSKWGDVMEGRKKHRGQDVGAMLYQERQCQRCGKSELRTVAS